MRINLEFADIDELQQFADWASARGGKFEQVVCGELSHTVDTRPVTAEGAVIPEDGNPMSDKDSQEPAGAGAGAGEPPSTDPAPEGAPKRKRRTKAQIAADEAAAKAASVAAGAQTLTDAVQSELAAALMSTQVVQHTDEGFKGPLGDALREAFGVKPEAPADEAATTGLHPDVLALAATIDGNDSLAHMNEARGFIASQGFPAYSETFKLTGLPSAIAGYTPEQVALHRAVMQWLTAQAGAK